MVPFKTIIVIHRSIKVSQIAEFLHMGGYGLYVWSSYGLCLIVLLINIVLPVQREKQIIKSLKKRQEREACS